MSSGSAVQIDFRIQTSQVLVKKRIYINFKWLLAREAHLQLREIMLAYISQAEIIF